MRGRPSHRPEDDLRDRDGRWCTEGRAQLQAIRGRGRKRVFLKEIAGWYEVSIQTIAELLSGEIRPGLDLAKRMEDSGKARIEMRAWGIPPRVSRSAKVRPESSRLPDIDSAAHTDREGENTDVAFLTTASHDRATEGRIRRGAGP